MILLKINPENPLHLLLEGRLKELSLAHHLEALNDLEEPILMEGSRTVSGIKGIDKHIDELEKVLVQWYDCRCDK